MATGANTKFRFFDIHRWDQPWFDELSSEYKLFWIYMEHKCNNVGVYTFNKRRVEFDVEINIDVDDIEEVFNKTETVIKRLQKNTFILIDFCKIQHCRKGPLLPKSKVIVSYMRDIVNSGVIDFFLKSQPGVISNETYIFLKAFEDGVLEFKDYSAKKKLMHNGLSEYEEALQKARAYYQNHYPDAFGMPLSNHSNDIVMPFPSHQGEGKGERKAAGKGEGEPTGMGLEKSTPFEKAKHIAELISGNSSHSIVKEVQAEIIKLEQSFLGLDIYSELLAIIDDLHRAHGKKEIPIELIGSQLRKKFNHLN